MIIEEPEAFKTWLTAVLKPMCDADPAALAKYVLALIKKDKTEEELQKIMVGQLEVFLEAETESFVSLVLKTLETQEYLTNPAIPNANPPNPLAAVKSDKAKSETNIRPPPIVVHPSELPSLSDAVNGSSVAAAAKKEHEAKRDRELRKSDNEKDDKRRVRHRSVSRNRSRSRSWDRSKRSKSPRDKRDQRPRTWRNKSPPRRFDRNRRSRTPTSPPTNRGRSRSPKHPHLAPRGRYRNRTPPRSTSRSRSRSVDKQRPPKEHTSRPGTPTQDSNHGDTDFRLTNSAQSIQSVVQNSTATNKRRCRDFDEQGYCMRGEMCPFDHGIDPVVLEDTALSSVLAYNSNEGPPPLMMGPRGIPPEYNPQAPQMWNRGGFRGGPRPPIGGMPRMNFPPPPLQSNNSNNMQRELVPVPVMDNKHHPNHHHQQHHHHHQNFNRGGGFSRDHDNMGGGGGPPPFKKKNFDFNRLGPRSKNPANCSLELKKIPQGLNTITHLNNHFSKFGKPINIQVFFEGDPEAAIVTFSSHAEANAAYRSTEAVLGNRFIKVFWHNNNPTGNGNNNLEGKQENVPPQQRSSVKDRLGMPSIVPPNTNKVLNLVQAQVGDENVPEGGGGGGGATVVLSSPPRPPTDFKLKREESKAQAAAAIKKNQELLAAKEKIKNRQNEKRKDMLKINDNLRKLKQELLERQLLQQKQLIEKMEELPPGHPQRDAILKSVKNTQEAIECIRKELLGSVKSVVAAVAVPTVATLLPNKAMTAPAVKAINNKEDVQREMLDAELDLITKQQEGGDTSEIQKKLIELKARAAVVANRGRGGRGGRRYNPIASRHLLSKNNLVGDHGKVKSVNKAFQKHTVDHRPTRLLVSGYEADEFESVLNHFQGFGEIVDYVTDATLPSITLNYKTRQEAERALLKGKHFQDRTLSITWCVVTTATGNQQQPTVTTTPVTTNANNNNNNGGAGVNRAANIRRKSMISDTDEDQLIEPALGEVDDELGPEINEETLLQDDEEEEDEGEDRSWRR